MKKNIIITCGLICLFILSIIILVQKDVLTSFEAASWVQAIGSIGAVIGLIYTFQKQNKSRQNEIDHERNLRKEEQARRKKREYELNVLVLQQIRIMLVEVIEWAKILLENQDPRCFLRDEFYVSHLLERFLRTEEHIHTFTEFTSYNNDAIYAIRMARNTLLYMQKILAIIPLQNNALNNKERDSIQKFKKELEEIYTSIKNLSERKTPSE